MFTSPAKDEFPAAAKYHALLAELRLDAHAIFDDPRVVPWRRLPDRENCTLDTTLADGRKIRLHIKRFPATRFASTPAQDEAAGYRMLESAGIPTVPLVGWGRLADGRSFLVSEDLAPYVPADQFIESRRSTRGGVAVAFPEVGKEALRLTVRLHEAGLHHQDLYLCHFFVRTGTPAEDAPPMRLIDAARVRPLPGTLLARRWIVKDLSQFIYSAQSLAVGEDACRGWFDRYCEERSLSMRNWLWSSVQRKVRRIARHDEKLKARQPHRNISVPPAQ